MKKQNTRRALLLSALALLVCVSMLVGSTYAWFTDSVVSANNIIKSGTLDVVLEYKTNWNDAWAPVEPDTKLFAENAKFEPGYTEVLFLRVSNAGSLALKYNLKVDVISEDPSTNMAGEEFKLSEHLKVGTYVMDEMASGANYANLLMPSMFGTREAALGSVASTMQPLASLVLGQDSAVLPGDDTAQVAVLVLNMPESVGNEANFKTGVEAPKINLGITLLATQLVAESDSFGPEYDENAEFPVVVNTISALKNAIENAAPEAVIKLDADIDLGGEKLVITEGKKLTINLNGNDLSGQWKDDGAYAMFDIKPGAELTITGDGNVAATTEFTASNRFGAIFTNSGKLTIEGGNYSLNDSTTGQSWIIATLVDNRTVSASAEAVLTINGGEFAVSGNAKNLFRNYPQQGGSATIVFNGGTFVANPTADVTYIWNQQHDSDPANVPGELYFNGGNFDAKIVYEDYNGQSDIHFANGTVVPGYSGNT